MLILSIVTLVAIKRGNPVLVSSLNSPQKQQRTDPLLSITTNQPVIVRKPIEMELVFESEEMPSVIEETTCITPEPVETAISEIPPFAKQLAVSIENEAYTELQDHFSTLIHQFQESSYHVRILLILSYYYF